MTPTRTSVQNVFQNRSTLYVNRMYQYEIPDATKKKAEKIMSTWLKLARIALRVRGGTVEHPLVNANDVAKSRTGWMRPSDDVLLPWGKVVRTNPDGTDVNPITDIIIPCKVDINSLSLTFEMIQNGDQKWANVSSRIRKNYKPQLLLTLMESDTLMDS